MALFLSRVLSTIPASHSVTYNCTFYNNWSAENHPVGYPSDAHWSPPVIAAHAESYRMWELGGLATAGVERVAEVGSTSTLERELRDATEEGNVGGFVKGRVTFNSDTQSQMLADDIALTPRFDRMSSVTMIAPSPDWFSGFDGVRPIDDDGGVWLRSFEVATYPWDAGTETGDDFVLSNPPEDPHVPILRFTKDTLPSSNNGVFLNPDGTEVLPVATWKCELKSSKSGKKQKTRRKRKRSKRGGRRNKAGKGG